MSNTLAGYWKVENGLAVFYPPLGESFKYSEQDLLREIEKSKKNQSKYFSEEYFKIHLNHFKYGLKLINPEHRDCKPE